MLIKLIKSVNFKEAYIAKHLMHLTETFAVNLLQIIVSDASLKKGPSSYYNQKCKFMTSQIHGGSSVN